MPKALWPRTAQRRISERIDDVRMEEEGASRLASLLFVRLAGMFTEILLGLFP